MSQARSSVDCGPRRFHVLSWLPHQVRSPETELAAIRVVPPGDVFVSPAMREQMLHRLVGEPRPANPTGVAQLSDRELEVFRLMGEGRTTRQIAQQLRVSVSTVETHRAHLKEKLGLRNAAELMRGAVEWVSQR
jgi:DNA-binding NarL/FixJ family response regulator